MKITPHSDLTRLMELMGTEATRDEASKLRDLLVERGETDTDKISDRAWSELIAEAINS